jgi:hypothetical protein
MQELPMATTCGGGHKLTLQGETLTPNQAKWEYHR